MLSCGTAWLRSRAPRSLSRYMDELRQKEQSLASVVDGERRFPAIMLAFVQTYVDASSTAQTTYFSADNRASPTSEQSAANAGQARKILQEYEPRDALAAIVAAARDRQIVILNEAHYAPRHRAFSTLLAMALRQQGFEYLAVETLDNRTPGVSEALQVRGYPLAEDGYYSKDPVFGDLLRRGLAAGFRVVSYEFTAFDADYEKLDGIQKQARRESGQAQNLLEKILAEIRARASSSTWAMDMSRRGSRISATAKSP